jgi:transposase
MTNARVEVITSVERRRRWSATEKQRLVEATLEPGASVSVLAREAGVHPNQLWGWRARGWRRQMRSATPTSFAPVRVAEKTSSTTLGGLGAVE